MATTASATSGNNNNNNSGSDKVFVHEYHDHSQDPIWPKLPEKAAQELQKLPPPSKRGATRQFPFKLYEMLKQASPGGFDEVVSWQPHGRSFLVRSPSRFVGEIMPQFFAQTKLASFQRQLSLYGFVRITQGKDTNAYYHELFLRGRPDLIHRLTRVRVKGHGCKLPTVPETEPDFYIMPHCPAQGGEDATNGGKNNNSHRTSIISADAAVSAMVVPSSVHSHSHSEPFLALSSSSSSYTTRESDPLDEYNSMSGDDASLISLQDEPQDMTVISISGPTSTTDDINIGPSLLRAYFGNTAMPVVQSQSANIVPKRTPLSPSVGPLYVPGRLLPSLQVVDTKVDTEKDAADKDNEEKSSSTTDNMAPIKFMPIKFMPVDLKQRAKEQKQEWDRFMKPQFKNEISREMIFMHWGQPSKMAEETASTSTVPETTSSSTITTEALADFPTPTTAPSSSSDDFAPTPTMMTSSGEASYVSQSSSSSSLCSQHENDDQDITDIGAKGCVEAPSSNSMAFDYDLVKTLDGDQDVMMFQYPTMNESIMDDLTFLLS